MSYTLSSMQARKLIVLYALLALACAEEEKLPGWVDRPLTDATGGDGDGDGDGDTGDGDGDGGDGDGDGDGDEPPCPLAEMLVPCDDQDDDPFHAIGLNCPGSAPESIPLISATFNSDPPAVQVAEQFGSSGDWDAREGEKVLIISTGTLPNPDNLGRVVLAEAEGEIGSANTNPDNVTDLPAPIEPQDGSGGVPFESCDGQNDCSDTLEAQWQLGESRAADLLWVRFDVQVPLGANGYEFDFAFFTTEYPEWIDTQYNDIFVVWSTSETYTGNVTFIEGQPLTVTALEDYFEYEGYDHQLDGTGVDGVGVGRTMSGPVGGGTGWFTASGSAAPEETFTLAWALFDMGDAYYDTTVVLDAFRWSCEGCIPSEVDGCGLEPLPQ